MYVIDPKKCSHPAQLRGKDGKMMCLVCGGEVKTPKPKNGQKQPEPPKDTEKSANENNDENDQREDD